jgi:hypothetical protein
MKAEELDADLHDCAIRQAIPQGAQERLPRCRGDCRSRAAADHRGFLIERGITVRQGVVPLRKTLPDILSSNTPALSPRMVNLIAELVRLA